jgi:hypothetical protein
MALIRVVATLRWALIFVGTTRSYLLECGRRSIAFAAFTALRPGKCLVFAIPIVVLVFVVEILRGRRRGIGRASTHRGLDGLRFLREILARRQLHIARGQTGEVARTEQARGLTRRSWANDEGGNYITWSRAEKMFNRLGNQLRVDGALRVERERGLGARLGIGAGVNRGGADAFTAKLIKQSIREVMKTAFDGGGNGAAGSGAVAIPA